MPWPPVLAGGLVLREESSDSHCDRERHQQETPVRKRARGEKSLTNLPQNPEKFVVMIEPKSREQAGGPRHLHAVPKGWT